MINTMEPHTIPESWKEPEELSHDQTAEAVRRMMEWVFRDVHKIKANSALAAEVFGRRAMVIAIAMHPEMFGTRDATRTAAERIGLSRPLREYYLDDLRKHFGVKKRTSSTTHGTPPHAP